MKQTTRGPLANTVHSLRMSLAALGVASSMLASAILPTTVFADEPVELTLTPLTSQLYVLFGQGGNIAVSVGADGLYIVDDQFAPLSDAIREKLRSLSPKAPEFVLNTHHHGDHTGGNENFAKAGAHIIAHQHVQQRLLAKHGADSAFVPAIGYQQQMTLRFNGQTATLEHWPHAHTDGDSLVWFRDANVLHMGDIFFNTGSLPFVDVDSGGSLQGIMACVDSVLSRIDEQTKLIPGHGPVANKADLQRYQQLLQRAKTLMTTAIAKHTSLEQVLAADPLAQLQLSYSDWLPKTRVTTLLYRSLTAPAADSSASHGQ